MMPPPLRTLASAGLLVGLLSGCAGRKGENDRPPTPVRHPGSTVTADDIERSGNSGQPLKELAARFPGVAVTESPGGGISVRIRGVSSFYSSNEPLYVVDGTPTQPGPGGTLALNVYDIASIQVLKDPSETGLYGMRGANGVIVIKTKRAR